MGLKQRVGAGYSIESVLSAVILFTFAVGALQAPAEKDWSDFKREVAVKDISFVLKETGDLDTFLRNSDTGAIRTTAKTISSQSLGVSGSIENLPINDMSVGFHTMPEFIHKNGTEQVTSDDHCDGDLGEITSESEYPVLKTNSTSSKLTDKHGVTLYFADSDPNNPEGFNEQKDYDALWVDNGTRCVFGPGEGPYLLDEIFMWGNRTDPNPENYYDFKNFDDVEETFTVYRADKAHRFDKGLSELLNGIETDTNVDTFNFSTPNLVDYDIVVFQRNSSLEKIDQNQDRFRGYMEDGSVFFLMNMTRGDLDYPILKDIGFDWMALDYTSSVSSYEATFSDYTVSEELDTYFRGMGGSAENISLEPGGKVISGQGATMTSRDDLLYARNTAFDVQELDGEAVGGWSPTGNGACNDGTIATFEFLDENFQTETYPVENVDIAETTSECGNERGLKIDRDGDGNREGPFLRNEIVEINNRRYVPKIESSTSAKFVFAGSRKVELINHRRVFENLQGERAARASFEEKYGEGDIDVLVSTLYWLRGDQVQFRSQGEPTALSTTVIGGISDEVFMPYKIDLRWSE